MGELHEIRKKNETRWAIGSSANPGGKPKDAEDRNSYGPEESGTTAAIIAKETGVGERTANGFRGWSRMWGLVLIQRSATWVCSASGHKYRRMRNLP